MLLALLWFLLNFIYFKWVILYTVLFVNKKIYDSLSALPAFITFFSFCPGIE